MFLISGYGSVAPKTPWGKLMTIIYAVIGIPLMLIYLSTTGEILSRYFRALYAKVFCVKARKPSQVDKKSKSKKLKTETTFLNASYAAKHNNIMDGKIPLTTESTDDMLKDRSGVYDCATEVCTLKHVCQHHPPVKVPILLCLFLILLYICGGAYLFHCIENWTYLESSFFCFASLSTIGFADLMPGLQYNINLSKKSSASGEIISVAISSTYILMGMAMIAMCFNLVQEQAVCALKKMTKFFGVINDNMEEKDELEGISMSIVSSNTSWQNQIERPDDSKKNHVGLNPEKNLLPILKQPNKILQTHTLPRRREDDKNRIRFGEFQRRAPARCSGSSIIKSTGSNEALEYFVPRSVSEFNLAGIVTDVVLIPPPPQTVIRPSSAASVLRSGRLGDPILIGNGKSREKMVTFEDDAIAMTNRKNLTAIEDVFMWQNAELKGICFWKDFFLCSYRRRGRILHPSDRIKLLVIIYIIIYNFPSHQKKRRHYQGWINLNIFWIIILILKLDSMKPWPNKTNNKAFLFLKKNNNLIFNSDDEEIFKVHKKGTESSLLNLKTLNIKQKKPKT